MSDWPETKQKLVTAGASLMRVRGFNATAVDDICHEVGVTKGAFFHYFKTKDDLAKAALAHFSEEKAEVYRNAPFRKLPDPLDRVFGRLDFAIESARQNRLTRGCLIGALAQELSFTNPALREACREAFEKITADFTADLVQAKALHAPRANIDPRSLAMLYVSTMQGSLMLAKAEESNQTLVDNLTQLRTHLELVFAQGTTKKKSVAA